MRIFIIVMSFVFQITMISDVLAGGAAAAKRKGGGGGAAAQQQMQQQLLQQQAMMRARQQAVQEEMADHLEIEVEREIIPEGEIIAQVEALPEEDVVKDIVDFQQLVDALQESARPWTLIIDEEAKEHVIAAYIKQYQDNGVQLLKSPSHYVPLIDEMTARSPNLLTQPFPQVLQVMAILEYDFNNGQDKDALALKVLGTQQALAANKKRLGL